MKILYHHRIRSKDGQYVHIEELTRALASLGHEIVMVGPSAVEEEEFGAEAGFVGFLKKYMPQFIYELLELAYAFVDYRRLVRAIKRHRPDCLYERYNLYLPSGVWASRRFGLPMLLEVNAPLYEERKKYNGIAIERLAHWSERFAWRGAGYVLPVTAVLAKYVKHAGVPNSRIVVIPNAIDPARFSRVPTRAQAKAALGLDDRLILGFVGFMRDWHGLERVIEMIAKHRETGCHLLLVGDGPARKSLEQRASSLGVADRVTFAGLVDRDNVARYIAAFDIALQPDVVPYASPLKLFEYLALGRAIVAPATPNLLEVLVDGENAALFDPADSSQFFATVERLCVDGALRERLARGAEQTIARGGFTWQRNAERVVALFRQLRPEVG
jgi:glycosyltransferase involved in cell wall biosynthesis